MGISYLWDTNTVIYFLQDLFPARSKPLLDKIIQESLPAISVITEIELLCWKTATDSDLNVLRSFIEEARVFELDKEIKLKSADIRKRTGLKLPDAIIAATTLVNNLTLVTRNVKDF